MDSFETICPGCFEEKGEAGVCPLCGYNEAVRRSPLLLKHRSLLADQFLVGRVLGDPGGFGITYLGLDIRLENLVAIKEYLPRDNAARDTDRSTVVPHSMEDEEMFRFGLRAFISEARTLAKFDHANLVRVRTFFEENGTGYLVMDYYEGMTLEEYLTQKGGRISEQLAKDIMLPILDGLRMVHDKGFLHRDIKPHNIYLAESGRPILLDFGAARFAMGDRSRSLSIVMTPGYAPYEQYHRKGQQGTWTDIYACGATLYRMVTGKAPAEATERKAHDNLSFPDNFVEVSDGFSCAVMQALSTDPSARPQSVREFQGLLFLGASSDISSAPSWEQEAEPTRVKNEPVVQHEPSSESNKPSTAAILSKSWRKLAGILTVALSVIFIVYFIGSDRSYKSDPLLNAPPSESRTETPSEPRPLLPNPDRYSLTVQTRPTDATVKILNSSSKYFPRVLLEPGDYHIEVSREGYRTHKQWVSLKNRNELIPVSLSVKSGDIIVSGSPAGADILLNGNKVGTLPATIKDVKIGVYTLEVKMKGYDPYETNTVVIVDQTIEATVRLSRADITNSLGMKFVYIEPGTFIMGSPESESGNWNHESSQQTEYTGEKVALDFHETDIHNIFRILQSISGENFAFDPDVKGTVSITMEKPLPWDQILDMILTMNDIGKVEHGGIIRIAKIETLHKEEMIRQQRVLNLQKKKVTLTKGYYIQTKPVSQWQWIAVMGYNPSGFFRCENCPVESVSWHDIQAFIRRIIRKSGKDYRLPTEAEWEYAARAGTNTRFFFGNDESRLSDYAWFRDNSGDKTHPVAQKRPNAWGLYDMYGNVREWVADWYGDYPSDSVTDPIGPSSGTYRVIRSCSWSSEASHCRSGYRKGYAPDFRVNNNGFRLILIPRY